MDRQKKGNFQNAIHGRLHIREIACTLQVWTETVQVRHKSDSALFFPSSPLGSSDFSHAGSCFSNLHRLIDVYNDILLQITDDLLCHSLDPLFIVDSIHMSRATPEYGFPVIDCANMPLSMNAAWSSGIISSTAVKSGRCRPYLSFTKVL